MNWTILHRNMIYFRYLWNWLYTFLLAVFIQHIILHPEVSKSCFSIRLRRDFYYVVFQAISIFIELVHENEEWDVNIMEWTWIRAICNYIENNRSFVLIYLQDMLFNCALFRGTVLPFWGMGQFHLKFLMSKLSNCALLSGKVLLVREWIT
jgi:hypothetical protein